MSENNTENKKYDFYANPLKAIAVEVHNLAKEKGWYEGENINVGEKLALIHAEISEALEEYRKGEACMGIYYEEGKHKPEGFAVEMIDAIIRILDLCEHLKIDLDEALRTKHAYNETRPYRHGGKRA